MELLRARKRINSPLIAVPSAFIFFLFSSLALLAQSLAPAVEKEVSPSTFEILAPGVEYRHEVRKDGPLSIHVLRIDLTQNAWEFHTGLGQGTVFGLEPLNGIVKRVSQSLQRPALAAINGDFFVIKADPYQGDPRGIQIIEGELVSRPNGSSFWIDADGKFHLGTIASKFRVIGPDGKEMPLGLNEERADEEAVLYTPRLGIPRGATPEKLPTTRTQGGRELLLEGIAGQPWLPLKAGKTYSARVKEIRESGNSPLSPEQMVLSIGPKKIAALPPIKPGDQLQLVLETTPELQGVQTALGAGRLLMQDGKMADVGPADQSRHPRSLIGWNQKSFYFIVIDGRQNGLSIGMTYPEMAALAKKYACTDAVELDGGGSSTLWAMGKILNSPSDGRPRAIANGLILFRKKKL